MQTLDFLDRINGALAEAWVPLLNKKCKFVDLHEVVPVVTAPILKNTGMTYLTWNIVPQGESYDINLFKLETKGFVRYKNHTYTPVGKWTSAPSFEVVEGLMAPTVGEIIKLALLRKLEKRIASQQQHVADSRIQLSDAEKLLYQLENELYQLKQSADTVRSEDSNLQEKQ